METGFSSPRGVLYSLRALNDAHVSPGDQP